MKRLVTPMGLFGLIALLDLEACRSESRESTERDSSANSAGGAATTAASATTDAAGAAGEQNIAGETGITGSGGTAEPTCPYYDPAAVEQASLVRLHPPDMYEIYVLGVIGDFAYFVEGGELRRIAHSGGSAEVLGVIGNSWVRLISKERLLWVEPAAEAGLLRIVGAPLANPADISVLVEATPSVTTLVVDHSDVFWSTRDPHDVFRAPLDGGTQELLLDGGEPLGAAVNDGYYYWIDAASDHLERIPVHGGERERLAPALFGGPMAAAGGVVVWGDSVLSTIEKWSPDTGRVNLAAAMDPLEIELVDGTVFWSQGLLSGSVRSIELSGDDPRDLLCRLRPRPSIHVDSDFLLVGGGSGLLRIAR